MNFAYWNFSKHGQLVVKNFRTSCAYQVLKHFFERIFLVWGNLRLPYRRGGRLRIGPLLHWPLKLLLGLMVLLVWLPFDKLHCSSVGLSGKLQFGLLSRYPAPYCLVNFLLCDFLNLFPVRGLCHEINVSNLG